MDEGQRRAGQGGLKPPVTSAKGKQVVYGIGNAEVRAEESIELASSAAYTHAAFYSNAVRCLIQGWMPKPRRRAIVPVSNVFGDGRWCFVLGCKSHNRAWSPNQNSPCHLAPGAKREHQRTLLGRIESWLLDPLGRPDPRGEQGALWNCNPRALPAFVRRTFLPCRCACIGCTPGLAGHRHRSRHALPGD